MVVFASSSLARGRQRPGNSRRAWGSIKRLFCEAGRCWRVASPDRPHAQWACLNGNLRFSRAFARMANSFLSGRARIGNSPRKASIESLPKVSMEPPGGVEPVLEMPVYPGVSLRYTEKAFVASLTCE